MSQPIELPRIYRMFSLVCWLLILSGIGVLLISVAVGLETLSAYPVDRNPLAGQFIITAVLSGLGSLWFGLLGLIAIDVRQKIGVAS